MGTAMGEGLAVPCGVYRQVLGPAWGALDESVRRFHGDGTLVHASGSFRIRHGCSWLSRVLARLQNMPRAGEAVPMQLTLTPLPGGEEWHRSFAGQRMMSTQHAAADGLLAERIGHSVLHFQLEVRDGALHLRTVRSALHLGRLRVPLPLWLSPRVTASETPTPDGRIAVSVQVDLPILGLFIAYEGTVTVRAAGGKVQHGGDAPEMAAVVADEGQSCP